MIKESPKNDIGQNLYSDMQSQQMHLIGYGYNSPLQLGDNLYVNLIVARPLSANGSKESSKHENRSDFPTSEILAYDLELFPDKNNKEKGLRLKDLGLLSGKDTILYQDTSTVSTISSTVDDNYEHKHTSFSLPTFFLPEDVNEPQLNILYGSCRKLHGNDGDSLTIADQLVSSSITDLKKRPSALFLIGDQIYADDVAGPLIKPLTSFANELLGWDETIDVINKKSRDLEIGERKKLLINNAKLTSEVSDNHLISFGEFAAMYLLTWNSRNWPDSFDEPPSIIQRKSKEKKNYYAQIKLLEQSRNNLPAVRRLFANIPIYMICDDHEITDDWNIDKKWHDSVKQSNCGSQIIANGLVAYWAFQAWGNDPESFDENFIKTIRDYIQLRRKLSTYQSNDSVDSQKNMEINHDSLADNMRLLEDKIWKSKKWIFLAPTNPFSVFLDCRTQREFVNPDGPPILLNDDAMSFIKSAVQRSKYNIGDPLIIISPTPVFGFELAESVQRFLTSISGTYKWDLETWRANEAGFIKFLSYLVENFNPTFCIFLSGDVHYSFTMKATFDLYKYDEEKKNKIIYSSMNIAQLTSSPLRSNSITKRILAIRILNLVHKVRVAKNMTRMGFNNIKENIYYNKDNAANNSFKTKPANKYYNYIHSIFSRKKDYQTKTKSSMYIKTKDGDEHLSSYSLSIEQASNTVQVPDWSESRLLIKPKGSGSTPVLANNNIGSVALDINSRIVRHKLYFLEKGIVKFSEADVKFEDKYNNF